MVNLPHLLKYVGLQGPIFEYKGAVFFLAIKATTWLWFGMVICIHHPHIHNGKYTPYVELCISKIKGAALS